MILCRHTFYHLVNEDILLILENMKDTGLVDYIALSNQPTVYNNR
jgi:hypothetical protein